MLLLVLLFGVMGYAQISYEPAFPNLRFQFPVEIQNANDGSDRMFVVEQSGRIRVFPNNPNASAIELQTFLDIRSRVSFSSGQEIGLLGLAFHPNFRTNRYIYVYFTDRPGNYRINVVRYQVSASNPNFVDPNTELLIASFVKNQSNSNHNGGKIAFGPDGYLYISVGDGGGAGDPRRNGQNLQTAFGSILRIDVDVDGNNPVETNPAQPTGRYEIPTDNPRRGISGLDELYAWGIRNTWKFSFDPSTNRLWGGDVGQGDLEEINLIQRGGNYGWNRFEGTSIENSSTALVTIPDIKPVFQYNHNSGDVSITSGYVYRGSITDPLIQGRFIFGDYVSGRVWSLNYNPSTGSASRDLLFRTNGQFVSSFGLDEDGEMYFSDYGSSVQLYRLQGENTGPVTLPVNGVGNWESPGNGTNGVVHAIAKSEEDIYYVGGQFTAAGGITTSNLAVYGDSGWRTIGGTNGQVLAIATAEDGRVYVGGDFSQIGGVTANNIAFWDGNSWNPLGGGTNGQVQSISIDENNRVYAGGSFESAGGVPANNIAFWENGTWSVLRNAGTGIQGTNNEIRVIAFDESRNVYVGGNFDSAGGISAPRIAVWNGSTWATLGTGTSGFVQAITVTPSFVYAGGNFALAGGQTVNRIARWVRGQNRWEPLNNGLSGNVNDLDFDGTFLYAAGSFETASNEENVNLIMNNAARWSSSSGWQALGPGTNVGVDNQINALEFNAERTQLWAGGSFDIAGNTSADNTAIWGIGAICTSESIIPEYQVNGIWNEGLNQVTVDEGDRVVLSILPNNIDFTIESPDGSIVNGDLNLGIVAPSDSGTYIYLTQAGCTERFELLVIESNFEDADADGVSDELDLCPDTPAGEEVDAAGCSDSQKDTDNDGINDDLDSCPGTPAGETVNAEGCSDSQIDSDDDGVNDNLDNCPNTPSGEAVDTEGCSDSQKDTDGDGVNDERDTCPDTPSGETVDAEGCSSSQQDSDNDGIVDIRDICPDTPAGETVDAEGCSDSQKDTDGDGVNDAVDTCPNTPSGEAVDAEGCADSQKDTDGDGVSDDRDVCPNTISGASVDSDGCSDSQKDSDGDGVNDDRDICPNTASGATVDSNGCSDAQKDSDNDGINDDRDACPGTPSGETVDADGCSDSQKDSDNDGVNDDRDTCPNTPAGQIPDVNGCSDSQKDTDNDGISDNVDICPNTPPGTSVDSSGCSGSTEDSDNDGVINEIDLCPATPPGVAVDSSGCSDSQRDSDQDGISDQRDTCPGTPLGAAVDGNGCSISQRDTDNDGVNDDLDICPNTPSGASVDATGCASSQKDTDNDGVTDDSDACSNTRPGVAVDSDGCSAAQRDSDNDGVNDDRDICPNTPSGVSVDSNGCSNSQTDSDNDGVNDDKDTCPNTPAGATVNAEGCSASQRDSDNDGVSDDRDTCPNTPAGESVNATGCAASQRDSDNDGVSDDRDTCPNTPAGESVNAAGCAASQRDSDNDGVSDDRDTCPNTPAGESVNAAGCAASQRDSDNDGVTNDRDKCSDTPPGTDVDDEGCPVDTIEDEDGDGVPDSIDVCPDTPQGSNVDEKGCPINSNIEQFSILSTGLSCRDSNDGFFEITSSVAGTYEVIVSGIDFEYTAASTFEISVQLENLRPGTYELCISGTGVNASQCFIGVISQPEPLEVEATVSALKTSMDLKLKGGSSYTITLNDLSFTTTSTEITLALDKGNNTLEVKTDKSCQGIFETVIITNFRASVSPNPFAQRFILDIPGNTEQQYDLSIYSVAGQLISVSKVSGGRTEMDLTSSPSGIYYLVIRNDDFEQLIKLVKK